MFGIPYTTARTVAGKREGRENPSLLLAQKHLGESLPLGHTCSCLWAYTIIKDSEDNGDHLVDPASFTKIAVRVRSELRHSFLLSH
jgi:hypothetical protein